MRGRHANVWGLMHKRSSLVLGTFLMLYYYILPNNRSWAWLTSLSNGEIHVCVHCTNVNTMTPPKMSILGGVSGWVVRVILVYHVYEWMGG